MQLCEWKGGIETIWLKINKQTLQFIIANTAFMTGLVIRLNIKDSV